MQKPGRLWTFLVLFVLCVPSSLRAYTFTPDFIGGIYWSQFPVQVQKFVTSAVDGPMLHTLVDQAQQEWENALGVEINLIFVAGK